MITRTPLDPDIADLIRAAPAHLNPDPHPTPAQVRADAAFFNSWMRGDVEAELADVPARDDTLAEVPVRWYGNEPDDDSDIIVFIHGGGWLAGDIDSYDPDVRRLARTTQTPVVSVEYRRTPEHRYPAPVDDCVAVVRELATRPHRTLSIAGDSAGGNLALGTSIAVRDERLLHAMLLIYPVVDPDAFSNASYTENGTEYLLTRAVMMDYWALYVDAHLASQHPAAAPSYATLHGLPAAVVVSADYDPLRDEDRELAARLIAADVDVTYLPHPGLTHGFQQMVPRVPAAAAALAAVYDAFLATIRRVTPRRVPATVAAP